MRFWPLLLSPLCFGEVPGLIHDLPEQRVEVAELREKVLCHLQQSLVLLLEGELSLEGQGVRYH